MTSLIAGCLDSFLLASVTEGGIRPYLYHVCRWLIVASGLLTCLAVRRQIRMAAFPLAGLFVIAADCRMYWFRFTVECLLYATGQLETVVRTTIWYVIWQLMPVVFVAVFGLGFAAEVRKLELRRKAQL
jgi:hypothetical protein